MYRALVCAVMCVSILALGLGAVMLSSKMVTVPIASVGASVVPAGTASTVLVVILTPVPGAAAAT